MINRVHIKFQVSDLSIGRVVGEREQRIPTNNRNYIFTEFSFSSVWDGLACIAVFSRPGLQTVHVPIVENVCPIPSEFMQTPGRITVSVFAGDLRTVNRSNIDVIESGYNPGVAPAPPTPTNVYVQSPNVPFIREDEGEFQYMVNGDWKGLGKPDPPSPPDPDPPSSLSDLPRIGRIEYRPGNIEEWTLTQKVPYTMWESEELKPRLFLRFHLDKPAPANCFLQIWRRSKRNRQRDPSWITAPSHMEVGDKRLVRETMMTAFRPIGLADGQRGDLGITRNPDAGFPVIPIAEGSTLVHIPEMLYDRANPRRAEDAFFVPKAMRGSSISNPKYADRMITAYDSKCILKFGTAIWIPGEKYACGMMSRDTLRIIEYFNWYKDWNDPTGQTLIKQLARHFKVE